MFFLKKYLGLFLLLLVLISCGPEHLIVVPESLYHPRPESILQWHPCDHGYPGSDCVLFDVPLDYANPDNGTIKIGISRLKAINENQRIGTLFVNDGGPGADGDAGLSLIDPIDPAYDGVIEEKKDFSLIHEHFDIIGFDPRGIGRGTHFYCSTKNISIAYYTSSSNSSISPKNYAALKKYNHDTGEACLHQSYRLISHINTRNIVDDMDSIRKALGEKTISYYGLSYGGEIGELYAEKYPTHLRAMVLDGGMNHMIDIWTLVGQEAMETDKVLHHLDQVCYNDKNCTLPGKSFIKALNITLHEAANGKLRTSKGEKISPDAVKIFLELSFYTTPIWKDIINLEMILHQDQTTLDYISKLDTAENSGQQRSQDVNDNFEFPVTVLCTDFNKTNLSFEKYQNYMTHLAKLSPDMYNALEFLPYAINCINRPIPDPNPPTPLHINPDVAILLVANEIDPIIPQINSIKLHKDIPHSRLIITDAIGHTAAYNSHCGRVAITQYLLTAQLPNHDKHCSG